MNRLQEAVEQRRDAYAEFVSNVKRFRSPHHVFQAPCCSQDVVTLRPGAGDWWESWTMCPHCGVRFVKVVTPEHVVTELEAGSGPASLVAAALAAVTRTVRNV